MADAPIIIIKKIKKAHAAHHGGAWKVAYADFVTAMMAFFLLLWLLNATTEEQKQGISDYFAPAAVSESSSGGGSLLSGRTIASPGAVRTGSSIPAVSVPLIPNDSQGDVGEKTNANMTDEEIEKEAARIENKRFDKAEKELRDAIAQDPTLQDVANNLLIDRTEEGLRIQIVDEEGKPMFPRGDAKMYERTKHLMEAVTKVIAKLPNKVSVTGHTDALPYRGIRAAYGNWELSSDRALESRRVLVETGLGIDRITKVVGRADQEHLVADFPNSPRNRRIAIVVLRDPKPVAAAAPPTPTPTPTPTPPSKQADNASDFKPDFSGPRLR